MTEFYSAAGAAAEYAALRTALPATAAEHGLMHGFPARPEKRVTWDNWIAAPFNRWGFQHVGIYCPICRCMGANAR